MIFDAFFSLETQKQVFFQCGINAKTNLEGDSRRQYTTIYLIQRWKVQIGSPQFDWKQFDLEYVFLLSGSQPFFGLCQY